VATALPTCREEVITMELTQRHNQPATRLGRRPAQAVVAAPALFALGVAVITWAEWDYMRGLGFTLTDLERRLQVDRYPVLDS
jgi:hypothetical protein